MMNLYVDVQAKLRTEFRNYGANVVVVAKAGQPLPANTLGKIQSAVGPQTLARAVLLRRRPHEGWAIRGSLSALTSRAPGNSPLVERKAIGQPRRNQQRRSSTLSSACVLPR